MSGKGGGARFQQKPPSQIVRRGDSLFSSARAQGNRVWDLGVGEAGDAGKAERDLRFTVKSSRLSVTIYMQACVTHNTSHAFMNGAHVCIFLMGICTQFIQFHAGRLGASRQT